MDSTGSRPAGEPPTGSREDADAAGTWFGGVRSVAEGVAFDAAGRVAIVGLGFLLNLVLTRGLGASLYGVFAFGRQIIMTVRLFTNLGSDVTVMKYVAANEDDPDYQRRVLGLAYVTTLAVSVAVAAGVFVGAGRIGAWTLDDPQFVTATRLFAFAIPFYALTKIGINAFRGLERPGYQSGLRVLHPASQLLAVGGALVLGAGLVGVVAAFVAATVVTFVVSFAAVVSGTHLRPAVPRDGDEVRTFFDFSLPYTLSRGGAVLYRRTDLFMIGILVSSSTALGIYNVALLVGSFVAMPLAGLNQLFPSVASRLYAEDEYDVLGSVYTTVTRWSITASLAVALPAVVYRETLLGLFGDAFVAGSGVLVVLVAGQLVNATAGPSNDVLTMTDHQYLVMINHWVFGVANVALNYVLVHRYGVAGAALATATVLALVNVARVVEVWYLVGLFAYTRRLWKPVVASVAATAALLGAKSVVSGVALLLVGGTLGLATFGVVLVAVGIDERDREFASRYVSLLE